LCIMKDAEVLFQPGDRFFAVCSKEPAAGHSERSEESAFRGDTSRSLVGALLGMTLSCHSERSEESAFRSLKQIPRRFAPRDDKHYFIVISGSIRPARRAG